MLHRVEVTGPALCQLEIGDAVTYEGDRWFVEEKITRPMDPPETSVTVILTRWEEPPGTYEEYTFS